MAANLKVVNKVEPAENVRRAWIRASQCQLGSGVAVVEGRKPATVGGMWRAGSRRLLVDRVGDWMCGVEH